MTNNDIDDMLFDLNDVIKVLEHHPISKEWRFKWFFIPVRQSVMLSDYPSDSIREKPETLFDLPKDFEGTQFTIGDCLETVQDHLLQLSRIGEK